MKKKNPIAVALGRMAEGVPKVLTDAERQRRAEALAKVRHKRWPDKKPKKQSKRLSVDRKAAKCK